MIESTSPLPGESVSAIGAQVAALPDRSLLLLDDDTAMRTRLGRALELRGFEVVLAAGVSNAITSVEARAPAFAVLDLRLADGSGLTVVDAIRAARPDARVIMLTGYGNIVTAVAAVKAGAVDYLSKPADADDVVRALLSQGKSASPSPPENPMSADRVRWEHIQRVYEMCGSNVSETARRLGMHRRTLQRILSKRAPK
jgi:two-component system response regulator RegA